MDSDDSATTAEFAEMHRTPRPAIVDPCPMPDEPATSDYFVAAPRVEAGWLLCRRVESGDADALFEAVVASLDHLRPWLPWVDGYTPEQARAFVERNAANPAAPVVPEASCLICDRNGQLLGVCGLHARSVRALSRSATGSTCDTSVGAWPRWRLPPSPSWP